MTWQNDLTSAQVLDAQCKFRGHAKGAKKRGITFLFTFDEWMGIWWGSGHWFERGCKKGQFVMCRTGDVGPYAIGNVRIDTCGANAREANVGKKHHSKSCTVDGVTIYPSRLALIAALGKGRRGSRSPSFRYI